MSKISINSSKATIREVREVIFERLRRSSNWDQFDFNEHGFREYVEITGEPTQRWRQFFFLANEVMWQLIIEGIIAPGSDSANMNLPFFHVTDFGRKVLESQGPPIYDSLGYLDFISQRVPKADATVLTYLRESLDTFRKGNLVASTVMLGIAAERVFILLCDSVEDAIGEEKEREKFGKIQRRYQMKPKLDFVVNKFQNIQSKKHEGFPDNASTMVLAVFDLLRKQRNENGHPQDDPPRLERDEVLANLNVFEAFYKNAEEVRIFLHNNEI